MENFGTFGMYNRQLMQVNKIVLFLLNLFVLKKSVSHPVDRSGSQ